MYIKSFYNALTKLLIYSALNDFLRNLRKKIMQNIKKNIIFLQFRRAVFIPKKKIEN